MTLTQHVNHQCEALHLVPEAMEGKKFGCNKSLRMPNLVLLYVLYLLSGTLDLHRQPLNIEAVRSWN